MIDSTADTQPGAAFVARRDEPLTAASGVRFTALLIFTQLPSVLAYTIALPLLAGMAHDLARDPASAYLAKLVSGILGPSMAIGAPVGGWMADKMDRRWLLIGLGALYLVSAVAPSFLPDLETIVAARFVTGFAAAALMAIGLTMVADYLPEHKRAGTLGMLSALNMVVSLLSLPAAGFVGNGGWRLPFLLYLLAAPLILLALPGALPVPQRPAAAPSEGTGIRWPSGVPYGLFLLALAVGVILTIPGIYVSFHLTSLGLGRMSTIGVLMMLNSAVAAGTSALFGKVWRRSPTMVFSLGFSTMGIGLIMLAYASGYAVAVPALLLMGAGMGLLAPSVVARVVDTVDERRRAKVVGAIQGTTSVAPLIGISMLEPLLPALGTAGVMLLVGLLSTGLFLLFALRRRS